MSYLTPEEARVAAADLAKLGRHARRLLAECIETQGVKRTRVSTAADALQDAGFVRILDRGNVFETDIEIVPTLAGEEAMEFLEEQEGC